MNNILAAFMFFTRLPFWRIKQVPAGCFKHVVNYWPFVGWLTGGVMAAVYSLAVHAFPVEIAVMLALIGRLLLTGALHEDGLADFFDGFGGGTDRSRILSIMKDSHIGSYGVIGLICYFALMVMLVASLPSRLTCFALLAFDAWSKFLASNLVNFLPYARKEEESKAHTVYERMKMHEFIIAFLGGSCWLLLLPFPLWEACVFSVVALSLLIVFMKKKLQGYTGDCCGATFLLCELASYLGLHLLLTFTSSI